MLVKKKISRGQWPKNRSFRLLMAAAMGVEPPEEPDNQEGEEEDSLEREEIISMPFFQVKKHSFLITGFSSVKLSRETHGEGIQ